MIDIKDLKDYKFQMNLNKAYNYFDYYSNDFLQ
jgi:hypothetical protein